MAFSIKNEEADRLARELRAVTGESLTEAVLEALRERLRREDRRRRAGRSARLRRLARDARELPVLDPRSADEIVGYDVHGLPG